MRKLFLSTVVALVAATWAFAAAPATDPVVGTWQLNVAKSKFKVGPMLKSQTRTYAQSGQDITLVMKSVATDGTEVTSRTTYQYDGQDYPVTGSPDFDSLSAQQADDSTARFILKKGGKPIGTTTRTLSKDGKMLTVTMKVTTPKGQSESELVLDKQ